MSQAPARRIRLYDEITVLVSLAIEKGNVKCQFGMAVYANANSQAAENESTV
jgi:hypothetical protein